MKIPPDKPKSNPPSSLRLVMPESRLLLVDDEAPVLRALKRVLGVKRPEWSVVVATGAVEALVHLEREAFDVVVSDFEMPHMNGIELMKVVKRHHPNAIRIILSGLERKQAGLIPAGLIHQWVSKLAGPAELIRACDELWCKRSLRKAAPRVG